MLRFAWGCALGAKFSMTAVRLKPGVEAVVDPDTQEPTGHYEYIENPITGEIERKWVPDVPDDPTTPDINERVDFVFPVEARAVITGGLNTQGTAERWTSKGEYENVDFVTIKFPKEIVITKRDRITNITDANGKIIWVEEEASVTNPGVIVPTVFEVNGVSPVVDPFGQHVENYALLSRAGAVEING